MAKDFPTEPNGSRKRHELRKYFATMYSQKLDIEPKLAAEFAEVTIAIIEQSYTWKD